MEINNIDYKNMLSDEEISNIIASDLLKIEAVFLKPYDPFTWASGILSPIYCDNRLTLTSTGVRNDVENGLATLIKRHFNEAELIMGTATAGIAHAAITASILDLPMGYVRSSAKDHGRKNLIEGRLKKGQKVVVVEDLISTGGSVLSAVSALREAGAEVIGIVSIFSYKMKKSEEVFKENNIKNVSLTNFDRVIKTAVKEDYIEESSIKDLLAFRDNPSDESWFKGAKQ